MKQLIPLLLGKENFPLVIWRAHHSPTVQQQDYKADPRPILVKFLNFQDKLRILRLAREKKEFIFKGERVHIYPDFSAGLLPKFRQFVTHKKKSFATWT